jgi:hypothetical protein
MTNPGQISTDDSRFAAVAVDGANNEFHVVNTAGHNYRYAVLRIPDKKIVFTIPGDKHSGAGVAVTHDGLLIVSAAIHDPATGNYPISHFAVPGVAQPFPGGGGGGGSTVDQPARLLAALRRLSRARWLLVHDAAECECWLDQGFVLVPPPAAIPAERAVQVLRWGTLPEDVYHLLAARGLEWRCDVHRRVVRRAPE